MIKAIVFDLDDTLHPKDQLRDSAVEQSVRAMIEKGLNCSIEEGVGKMKEITEGNPRWDMFYETARYFGCEDLGVWEYGHEVYKNADFTELKLFPESNEVLTKLKEIGLKLFLVTQGSIRQQEKKVNVLGLRDYFDEIFLCNDREKESLFFKIINFGFDPSEVLVIGDNIFNEIKIGNKLGMKTIRILEGKYSILQPQEELEKPDYEINNLKEVLRIVGELNEGKKDLKIVAIGGGTGLPTLAEGLRKYTNDLSLIVTVTDSGRSSGMLRKEMNVLPPGDLRNCLIALSNSEKQMCDLFQYRFENGSLNGHNFGNLFIAALTKITGSFEKAVEEAGKILKLEGRVLPSTLDDVHVCVELEDGIVIEEENNIIDRDNFNVHLRSPIKKVFLKPNAAPNPKAVKVIEEAEIIVLCPGSLFTSVIPNLLVDGIKGAISKSSAKKVYVCNIMTQVSQTHNFKASEHVRRINEYLDGMLDYVVLNTLKPVEDLIELYKDENAFLVENDLEVVRGMGVEVIEGDFLDDIEEKKLLWEKKDLLRHNPDKIARAIVGLCER